MHFTTLANGLPGNDDYGTLSAYVLFTSIGLYPQAATSRYFIGSPSISSISMSLTDVTGSENGRLTIKTYNNSDVNVYVDKLYVNEQLYMQPFIEHSLLVADGGATLEFHMSDQPRSGLCFSDGC